MLFGHGDDIAACSRPVEGNFSSNVWFDGYTDEVKALVASAIGRVESYPEPDARSLRDIIASSFAVSYSNVMVSNGAIEAIYLIAQAWKRKRSLVVVPTFSEYEDACRLHEHELLYINEEDFDGAVPDGAEVVWLCNPNNPTGTVRRREMLLSMVEQHPEVMFVIDQSYGSFYPHELLLHSDVLRYRNLIIICSLTKCYAIPGMRVGYVVSSDENISMMLGVRIPWSVNALAVEVAKHFVLNRSSYVLPLSRWMSLKRALCERLSTISFLEIIPSETPYFLVKLHRGTSSELKAYLADCHGLLIRDASNFRGLDSRYVRIAPQDEATNCKLFNAIRQWNPI